MDFETIAKKDKEYIMPTYGRFPVALEEGHGAVAVDCAGREYVDFGSGIGVNSLGYAEPGWAEAVARQAAKLQHTSNLYYSEAQVKLAQRLCELSGMGRAFLCNSGAEANECAIKLARKYSFDTCGRGRGGDYHPAKFLPRPHGDHSGRHGAGGLPQLLLPLYRRLCLCAGGGYGSLAESGVRKDLRCYD